MTVKTEIEQQLEALIAIGERLSASYHRDGRELVISYASSESETSLRAFYTGAVAAIGRIAGEDSDYYRAGAGIADQGVVSKPGAHPSLIPGVTGALIALRDSVRAELTCNRSKPVLPQTFTMICLSRPARC